jgi:LmbE family N-acetylglucosaminyl deacetylase
VAHPDDETLGAGALLARLPDAWILHATDGAPVDPSLRPEDLRARTRDEYARLRRDELLAALSVAGIPHDRAIGFGARDQEASFAMPALARWVESMLLEIAPDVVITHPYEGGHPDHDAVAFAAHAAIALLPARGIAAPALVEAASYHARGGEVAMLEFLPAPSAPVVWTTVLGDAERVRKLRMLACHASQRGVLAPFPTHAEHFRAAPAYAFLEAPHQGALRYEQLGWPLRGQRWRELARAAMYELGLTSGAYP